MINPQLIETLETVLRMRRSVRDFRLDRVDSQLIERLLEAAVMAPSASNKQPWRFIVVEAREIIGAMAQAVRAAAARLEASVPPESRDAVRAYDEYFTRFEAAPVLIVPIHRSAQLLAHLAGPGLAEADGAALAAMERDNGLMGASLAVGNVLLAATALGLGASPMTGPLIAAPALAQILEVPRGWSLACVIAIGWPASYPLATERKPPSSVTRWL